MKNEQSTILEFELKIGSTEAKNESAIRFERGRVGLLLHIKDDEQRERLARKSIGLEYDLISATGLSHPDTRDEYIEEKLRELDDNYFEYLSERINSKA